MEVVSVEHFYMVYPLVNQEQAKPSETFVIQIKRSPIETTGLTQKKKLESERINDTSNDFQEQEVFAKRKFDRGDESKPITLLTIEIKFRAFIHERKEQGA